MIDPFEILLNEVNEAARTDTVSVAIMAAASSRLCLNFEIGEVVSRDALIEALSQAFARAMLAVPEETIDSAELRTISSL